MDRNRYLYDGSPLIWSHDPEVMERIMNEVFEIYQFPQDAISGSLIVESMTVFPKIMPKVCETFKIRADDYGLIWRGYLNSMYAVHLALWIRDKGVDNFQITEYNTLVSKVTKDEDEIIYFRNNANDIGNLLIADPTCASIFDHLASVPMHNNDYFILGIELGKFRFGSYGMMIVMLLNKEFGPFETQRILSGNT